MSLRIAALASHFTRDVDACLERIGWVVEEARTEGVDLLVLPHGALGGYHDVLDGRRRTDPELPPAVAVDGPELDALRALAGPLVVVLGVTEAVGDRRANTAVCLSGAGIHHVHRKVHLPSGEVPYYVAGDRIRAADTPVGRVGLMVDYDKTFPEIARSLALDGADLLAVPSAWPASRTNRTNLVNDRERRMFDLYDQARAAENQVVLVSANQTGRHGSLQFFGRSKVVRPDGSRAAVVGARAGLAIADVDVAADVARARARFHHLKERRPDLYADGA